MNKKKAEVASCWLRIAAKANDTRAQAFLAAILYGGIGVPVNLTEALTWAQKASDQGDYLGENILSLMYESGEGVSKDAKKAEYFRAKSQQDKFALIKAQQEAADRRNQQQQQTQTMQAQRSQQQNVGAILLFGLMLGAISGDSSSSSGSRRPDSLDRYNGLKESCSMGSSSSCGMIDMKPPSNQ